MRDLMLQSDRLATGVLAVNSPFDGRELDQVATCGVDHVDDALAAAHSLFRDRNCWLSIPERLEVLSKAAAIMQTQVEELTLLATSEGGKPYTDSKVEVIRAIDGMHLCAEKLRSHPGKVIPIGTTPATTGRIAFTQKEPIGVVVAVSAFNHPLNLIVHQVGPAWQAAARSSSNRQRIRRCRVFDSSRYYEKPDCRMPGARSSSPTIATRPRSSSPIRALVFSALSVAHALDGCCDQNSRPACVARWNTAEPRRYSSHYRMIGTPRWRRRSKVVFIMPDKSVCQYNAYSRRQPTAKILRLRLRTRHPS